MAAVPEAPPGCVFVFPMATALVSRAYQHGQPPARLTEPTCLLFIRTFCSGLSVRNTALPRAEHTPNTALLRSGGRGCWTRRAWEVVFCFLNDALQRPDTASSPPVPAENTCFPGQVE